jgi:DNA-binding NarL/FixJ family response regulator
VTSSLSVKLLAGNTPGRLVPRSAAPGQARRGSRPARIVLADDHELTLAGLRAVIAQDDALEVVGLARDGLEAVALTRTLQPDLVLMDVRMPNMGGLEAMRELKQISPSTIVLILSMFPDVELLLEAVRAGAAGYVLKTADEASLRAAIHEALAGDLPVDPSMTRELVQRLAAEGETPPTLSTPPDPLTAREHEVLVLLAQGNRNREIAEKLIITQHTVKIHVEHILAKLGVSDRTQAAVRGIELGYISADTR